MEEWRWTAKAAAVDSLDSVRMAHAEVAGPMDGVRALFRSASDAVPATRTATAEIRDHGMKRIVGFRTASGNILSFCAPHIGLQQGVMAPGWHAWGQHLVAADDHVNTALQRLHSAWTSGRAATGVLSMLRDSPPPSPVWNDWGPAALDLLRQATDELEMAMDAVRLMQHALLVKFVIARRLLLVISVRHPQA
ncbi:hypothetical protein BRADI_1g45732v3 [Brachypodium distachyon]|uniref:Uncharacterized protein n=1 Tax=Brachypodium distachyon TaxID=15368 RepID=A0A0Q3L744_BRADI|nr:hypothetical protein BRADI_1g45732v3 [Brachypodium distachyon]